MKHFVNLRDFSQAEIAAILDLARELKHLQKKSISHQRLSGKTLAMLFEKPSNRTRLSFEVAMYQLGGHAINIRPDEVQMGKRESIADVAKVFSRFVDGVMIRARDQNDIIELANHSSVPVINGLSDTCHPCQAVADILTIEEKKGSLANIGLCYIGDGNNVCNSLIDICEILEISLVVCCPDGYGPKVDRQLSNVSFESQPSQAVVGADVIYTDTWVSMGMEGETTKRLADFRGYGVTKELLGLSKGDAIFMHCLPAHRGEEVDLDVIDGPLSVVFDQAENRLHAQKGILAFLLG